MHLSSLCVFLYDKKFWTPPGAGSGTPRLPGRPCRGALEAFDLRHQKLQVCIEKFEEFDARTG